MNRKFATVNAPVPIQKVSHFFEEKSQPNSTMCKLTSLDIYTQHSSSPKSSFSQPKFLKYNISELSPSHLKVDHDLIITEDSSTKQFHSVQDNDKSSIQSSSSNSSFSSNLSDNSHNDTLFVHSITTDNSVISASTFKNRLKFWEEQGKFDESCFPSGPSASLRLKRSSYFAYSPEKNYYSRTEKNSKKLQLHYSNYTSKDELYFKASSSSDFQSFDQSQSGLYIANSMREAKMQSPIDSLLGRIILLFDSPVYDIIKPDSTTPYSFFLFYKWIGLSSHVLACKLRLLFSYQTEYTDEGRLKPLSQLKPATNQQKLQVTQAFRYWMRVFPEDFPPDSLVLDVMHSLKEVMRKENTHQLINLLELQFFDSNSYNRKLSLVQYPNQVFDLAILGENSAKNHETFEILKIPSEELAKIIIWLEFSLFLQIPFYEFKHYTKLQNSSKTPHIYSSINESNSISMWVKSSILNEEATDERALIIEKLIDVANEVRKLHAYQSLMSFIGAINSGCICMQRLHLTWSLVPKEKIRIFEELSSLLTVQNNYYMYRNELEHIKQQENVFYFPVLGVLFKDLIQLDSKTNTLDTGDKIEVNENKLILVARVIETWRKSQYAILPKSPNVGLVDLVKAAIHLCSILDEDELYKKSFVHEPVAKECSTCPLKENEFFSKFIQNFDKEKIDPAVVKLHVQAMTKAIFSTYDKDHSGYLTEEEFLHIQKNFPFIHNFSQIDKNKDGVIGEEEFYVFLFTSLGIIRNYFTHNFKEFHEFLPAVCTHCKSIMWCPIEAAFKCRDCELICHKYCRDKLVAECKPNLLISKKHKNIKSKDSKAKVFGSFISDRNRHHSATELTERSSVDESCDTQINNNSTCVENDAMVNVDNTVIQTEKDQPLLTSMFDNNYNEVISKLSVDNERLLTQLNSALTALYHVKVENRSLQKQLELVESKLNLTNNDLQVNNVELQRQFSNVRNATGEFLLQQVALLNSSKSQTYL